MLCEAPGRQLSALHIYLHQKNLGNVIMCAMLPSITRVYLATTWHLTPERRKPDYTVFMTVI